jgi:predicted enzyme related to lactoylglutathione lyase
MFHYVKFAELPVSNQERALKFYTEQLGLRVADNFPYQNGWRWISLEIPGATTQLLFTRRSHELATDVPTIILVTDDVTATYEALRKKGIVFTQAPSAASWNPQEHFALLRDSEGNTVMISDDPQ